jgi:protein ImuB
MAHEPRHRQDDTTPPYTALDIEQAEPGNDTAHLQLLLRERLARSPLPAPTLELRIRCHDLAFSEAPSGELFPTRASEHEGLLRLVERLQARLGRERVTRLEPVADHRPERGTRLPPLDPAEAARVARGLPADTPPAPAGAVAVGSGLAQAYTRPLWLNDPPEPLASRQSAPWLEGHPLAVLAGPERLEAGWWDGEPIARDYFIAQAHDGALVWIYRSRLPGADDDDTDAPSPTGPSRGGGWFLQGRFG